MELLFAVWSRGELFPDALARARAERGDEPLRNDARYRREGDVAVIPVYGPMFRHADLLSEISGATSYQRISKDLQAALADEGIARIVLDIDSPGGEAAGCGELAEQIRATSKQKRVIAYAGGACASGAYWLASAASEIVAAPSAVLGCLGCRIALMDSSGAQEKAGVKRIEIISSQTPAKRGTPVDDQVRARAQTWADDLADVFIGAVAELRGVSREKVIKDYGGGDVLIASKARAAGMADRIGTMTTILQPQEEQSMTTTPPPPAASPAAAAAPAASAELLAGLKALLGTDDTTQVLAEVAALQADRRALKDLQARQPERRQAALQLARSRELAPVQLAQLEQMAADTQIPVEVLERCASTWAPPVKRVQPSAAAPTASAEPHPGVKTPEVTLTEADKINFARCGITDEAQMLEAKKSMLGKESR